MRMEEEAENSAREKPGCEENEMARRTVGKKTKTTMEKRKRVKTKTVEEPWGVCLGRDSLEFRIS